MYLYVCLRRWGGKREESSVGTSVSLIFTFEVVRARFSLLG